jgi:hypothetical protein
VTGLLRNGFGATSDSSFTHYQQQLAKSWLRGRYWGEAIALNSAQVDDLPEWDDLPDGVKHFFKLLHLLSQPGAQFFTIRLDLLIGEKALAAARGPVDWLANKIKRALESVGAPADQIAFALEFAPKQAKTLHRLHIHGALCIPTELLKNASEALREALAPDYILHGSNAAVRFETPAKVGDVAKYVVKESGITKARIVQTLSRGSAVKGSSPLRASAKATSGGRTIYNSLREKLFGRPDAVGVSTNAV